MYKQPIIIFGIIVPLLFAAAMIGGVFFLKKTMTEKFTVRSDEYMAYIRSRNMAMQVEGKIAKQRPHLERWKTELSQETTSAFRTNLKAIAEKLPSKEFQETSFNPIPGRGGFGTASAQKSSQLSLGVRGTFRSVQRALLELEARMPQLQLQEIKIEPSTQNNLLNFQISYTAWEN